MKVIQDFNASVPSNFSESLSRAIPASPSSITLASFGLAVNTTNSTVLLIGTVGIESFLGLPDVSLKIFRNTALIGTIQVSTLAINEVRNNTFQIVDSNPPVGYHAYTLTAEVVNPLLNQATATGPISFSGTSLAPGV
ncbi:hypothetical protein [Priestia aryabhattai]|uniref:hypothetical protein n=1 Tax=Priestia aryabhattai TaxID=412384 RepID=UPI002E1B5DC0|nr:hypothetical protein [Priestia aryabhattai]